MIKIYSYVLMFIRGRKERVHKSNMWHAKKLFISSYILQENKSRYVSGVVNRWP